MLQPVPFITVALAHKSQQGACVIRGQLTHDELRSTSSFHTSVSHSTPTRLIAVILLSLVHCLTAFHIPLYGFLNGLFRQHSFTGS